MNIEELIRDYLKLLKTRNSRSAVLVNQLLEYWAAIQDNEIKNRLLQDLVFKYAAAEKKLTQLNRELIEKQKRIEEDLAAAAEIQKSLLPPKIKSMANVAVAWNFEPCEHIGGDIFNLMPLDDEHLAIYMLDVSGHGVPAAMVAVAVSQVLQPHTGYLLAQTARASSRPNLKSPVEVLDALDQEFPFERFNNFFTITYLILNTTTGDLRYGNAGHPPPVLVRKNGALDLLTKGGPGIGMRSFRPSNQQNV
ncbi:MAG: SpoIIE family protein phosphatase, partial [Desulfobacterales bacterium]